MIIFDYSECVHTDIQLVHVMKDNRKVLMCSCSKLCMLNRNDCTYDQKTRLGRKINRHLFVSCSLCFNKPRHE